MRPFVNRRMDRAVPILLQMPEIPAEVRLICRRIRLSQMLWEGVALITTCVFAEGAIYYNDQGYQLEEDDGGPTISRPAALAKFYNILEKKQLNSRGDARTIG